MNILKEFPSEFIGAADVAAASAGGKPCRLTVKAVTRGTARDQKSGQDKDIPEMSFQGTTKRLRLNKSSIGLMVHAWGAETDAWTGKDVDLSCIQTNLPDKTTGEKKLGVLCRPARGDRKPAKQTQPQPPEDDLAFDGPIPE